MRSRKSATHNIYGQQWAFGRSGGFEWFGRLIQQKLICVLTTTVFQSVARLPHYTEFTHAPDDRTKQEFLLGNIFPCSLCSFGLVQVVVE